MQGNWSVKLLARKRALRPGERSVLLVTHPPEGLEPVDEVVVLP
jgi:hypothetical protein